MNMDDSNYVDFEEAKPPKDNKRTIIIVVAAVVLLCCCCISLYVGYRYLGDPIVEFLRTNFGL